MWIDFLLKVKDTNSESLSWILKWNEATSKIHLNRPGTCLLKFNIKMLLFITGLRLQIFSLISEKAFPLLGFLQSSVLFPFLRDWCLTSRLALQVFASRLWRKAISVLKPAFLFTDINTVTTHVGTAAPQKQHLAQFRWALHGQFMCSDPDVDKAVIGLRIIKYSCERKFYQYNYLGPKGKSFYVRKIEH